MEPETIADLYKRLLEANHKQTLEIKTANEEQVNKIQTEFQTQHRIISEKIDKSNAKIEIIEKRCLQLERNKRKNNIVVFGLEVNKESILEETTQKLNQLLQLHIGKTDINNIYQIGANNNSPVLIEFMSYLKKSEIFKNVQKLKGTSISIANDLCAEDREIQKILRKHLKEAREKQLDAKIKGNQLIIENKLYSVEDLEKETDIETDVSDEEDNEEESEEIELEGKGENKDATSSGIENNYISEKQSRKRKDKTPSPQERNITRSHRNKKTKN